MMTFFVIVINVFFATNVCRLTKNIMNAMVRKHASLKLFYVNYYVVARVFNLILGLDSFLDMSGFKENQLYNWVPAH